MLVVWNSFNCIWMRFPNVMTTWQQPHQNKQKKWWPNDGQRKLWNLNYSGKTCFVTADFSVLNNCCVAEISETKKKLIFCTQKLIICAQIESIHLKVINVKASNRKSRIKFVNHSDTNETAHLIDFTAWNIHFPLRKHLFLQDRSRLP